MIRSAFSNIYIPVLMLTGLVWCAAANADEHQYPKTIEALQSRYGKEVIAHNKYYAYAEHALQEGYPAIAHLFRAFGSAEAIHAKNFERLLKKLGQAPVAPPLEFEITTTRDHLQQTATLEADEIDDEYPKLLAGIQDEGHQEAILFINYAWRSEQQHRELILKIKKAASWFFGMLVSKIEGDPTHYYVCQICGSTVTELPTENCSICDHPRSEYQEIPGFQTDKSKPGISLE